MKRIWFFSPLVLALVVWFVGCDQRVLTDPTETDGPELLAKKFKPDQQYEFVL